MHALVEVADQPAVSLRWHSAYEVSGVNGSFIPLRQINAKEFKLPDEVSLRYLKATGLEKYVSDRRFGKRRHKLTVKQLEDVRTVRGRDVEPFDLASVPGPLRWFVRAYGDHTAAAIFHDHLIPSAGTAPEIPEVYADRYFRFQLGAVGVPRLKRYVMWTATAMRTRWAAKGRRRAMVVAWALLAVAGILALLASIADMAWGTGVPWLPAETWLVGSLITPSIASSLWGRQYGAGIVAAIGALWMLPPAILAAAGWLVYWVLECVNRKASDWLGRPS